MTPNTLVTTGSSQTGRCLQSLRRRSEAFLPVRDSLCASLTLLLADTTIVRVPFLHRWTQLEFYPTTGWTVDLVGPAIVCNPYPLQLANGPSIRHSGPHSTVTNGISTS